MEAPVPRGRKAWFGPRPFGYGYTPISWEGWAVTAVLAAVILISTALLHGAPLILTLILLAALAAFLWIANRRFDGELAWRWNGRRLR